MTKKSKRKTDNPFTERRGTSNGGRRKTDQADQEKNQKSSKIWFALSVILTLVIMAWTFSIPFRSKASIMEWETPEPASHPTVSPAIMRHPEHQMSDKSYMAYINDLDADLLYQVEERNRVPRHLPDKSHAMQQANKLYIRAKSQLAELEKIQKLQKHNFDEKSIQGQKIKRLKEWLATTSS